MKPIDPYDVERVRQYRAVFFQSPEGPAVLEDILDELNHFATRPLAEYSSETQLALEHQAKLILDKLGIFRANNLDGYITAMKNVHPRHYHLEDEPEE